MSGLRFDVKAATNMLWADAGTGAHWDGSFWRPDLEDGYYLLGDICQSNWGPATGAAVIVRPVESGRGPPPLAPPKSMTMAWNNGIGTDRGSCKGDYGPVSLWWLNPEPGYRALGVAVNTDLYSIPDLSLFRCVREDLCLDVDTATESYEDSHSGINLDVRCDTIVAGDLDVLVSGSFAAAASHDAPAGPFSVLKHGAVGIGGQGVIRGLI